MLDCPRIKLLKINVNDLSFESKITNAILKDFQNFKNRNELKYCSLHQSKPYGNNVDVTFSTTIKYPGLLVDVDIIQRDFDDFAENNKGDYCQITKTTCQENCFVAEFSVQTTYCLSFISK